jgi:hypothetical protein
METREDWRKGCYYNNKKYNVFGVNYSFKYIIWICYQVLKTPYYDINNHAIYSYLYLEKKKLYINNGTTRRCIKSH